jgi:hypothetical protein
LQFVSVVVIRNTIAISVIALLPVLVFIGKQSFRKYTLISI